MNAILADNMEELNRSMAENGEAAPKPEISLVWDKDLCARNTALPESLIAGYLNRGEVSILAGASKAGKSWMALQMAKAIGAGIPFLDRETKSGTSVYINTEIAAPFWEQRSREMNDKLAMTSFPNVLHASTRGQSLTTANVIPLLKEALARKQLKQVDFIVIDPYYTLTAGLDENSAGEVAKAMLGFQKMAEDLGAAVLITHHFTKGNAAGRNMLDRASGSGVFARSVDNFITLTENAKDQMVLEATRRNAVSPPPLEVKFEYPIWKAVGEAEPVGTRRRGRASDYDPQDFVTAFPDAEALMSGPQLRKALGLPGSTFSRYKGKAIAEGVISEQSGGFRLTEQGMAMKRGDGDEAAPTAAVP